MAVLRVVHSRELDEGDRSILFERRAPLHEIVPTVQEIMEAVRLGGDDALRRFTERFDGPHLGALRAASEEFDEAERLLAPAARHALERAMVNVRAFHEPQRPREERIETAPGVCAWREWRPIERVGLYVPGGRGAYPSSVIMLGVPAAVA